jgi:hypothetical protein
MVSKTTSTEKPKPRGRSGGRKPGNPADVKTTRIVMRSHPDLVEAIAQRAKTYGVSRTELIERIMISYLNLQADQKPLDWSGRYVTSPEQANWARMSIGDQWAAFGRRNQAIFGQRLDKRAAELRQQGQDIPERDADDGEGNTE